MNVQQHSASKKDIHITENAKAHILGQLKKHPQAIGMCLAVKKAGCSGLKYDLHIIEACTATDKVFTLDEQHAVYVPIESYPYLKGTVVELSQQGLNAKIVFKNPNAENACGCGESFNFIENN